MKFYSVIKTKKPFVTQMNLKGIMPSETSKAEKEKYHMILFTCIRNIKQKVAEK